MKRGERAAITSGDGCRPPRPESNAKPCQTSLTNPSRTVIFVERVSL
jgi:hypothetical protein